MATTDPLKQFESLLADSEFLFVVYFRGHWCPFCISWLRDFSSLSPAITAARGTPLIVTAEPEVHLAATRSASGYSGEAIIDPSHVLAKDLKRRGWVDVATTEKKGYEHGMAQPAVLVVKSDGTVLESWAIVPSMMNIGGAKDRPYLREIWENVQAKMKGRQVARQRYSSKGFISLIREKIVG